MQELNKLEKIISLCKEGDLCFRVPRYTADLREHTTGGRLELSFRRNVVNEWTQAMQNRDNMALLDSSIFTAAKVWEASGPCVRILRSNGSLQSLPHEISRRSFA